jgi:hypothetical protein
MVNSSWTGCPGSMAMDHDPLTIGEESCNPVNPSHFWLMVDSSWTESLGNSVNDPLTIGKESCNLLILIIFG